MSTMNRVTRIGSGLAALTAGAALGVMLNTITVEAAQPTPSIGQSGAERTVAAAEPATGPHIEITKHKFSVPTITIPAGTTVTWINHDDDAHTVASTTSVFRSPGLDTDDTYSFRFTKPGTYKYFCTLHPLMVGTVIVR